MLIHEAIQATTVKKPCITRRKWQEGYYLAGTGKGGVRLMPTNSPDGCILLGGHTTIPRCGWQPTAEDLVADDWDAVQII